MSINWYENCEKQEVTLGATGFKAGSARPKLEEQLVGCCKNRRKTVSRISRRVLAEDFVEKFAHLRRDDDFRNLEYGDMKALANKYAEQRDIFLETENFKNWTKKDAKLSAFKL